MPLPQMIYVSGRAACPWCGAASKNPMSIKQHMRTECEHRCDEHGWRPIETAPKDGRMVLLYPSRCWVEDADRGEVGYWDSWSDSWEGQGSRADDYTGPTRWMPLPPPPKE